MGNKSENAAPHNAYRCLGEDRWCAIAVFTDDEWQGLCRVIGRPELANDVRFSTLLARKQNEHALDQVVNEWTSTHTAEEVMTLMQAAGVPAGVAQTGEDLVEHDPLLRHRHTFKELEYPGVGKYRSFTGTHFLMSKYEVQMAPAPLMGAHNAYVFKEILGMGDAEYDTLVKDGVID